MASVGASLAASFGGPESLEPASAGVGDGAPEPEPLLLPELDAAEPLTSAAGSEALPLRMDSSSPLSPAISPSPTMASLPSGATESADVDSMTQPVDRAKKNAKRRPVGRTRKVMAAARASRVPVWGARNLRRSSGVELCQWVPG
jgi:hypothetical protein